jgi:hypothetical protein
VSGEQHSRRYISLLREFHSRLATNWSRKEHTGRAECRRCVPKRTYQLGTFILDPIAVRLHYSRQAITPIPLSRNLLEPKLFLIWTLALQAPSLGLSL